MQLYRDSQTFIVKIIRLMRLQAQTPESQFKRIKVDRATPHLVNPLVIHINYRS